jgi:hypothetical protein
LIVVEIANIKRQQRIKNPVYRAMSISLIGKMRKKKRFNGHFLIKKEHIMIVICAWCQEFIREKEPIKNIDVTHGICKECEETLLNGEDECLKPELFIIKQK